MFWKLNKYVGWYIHHILYMILHIHIHSPLILYQRVIEIYNMRIRLNFIQVGMM